MSTMKEQPRDLTQALATRVRTLRTARGLTLDALAAASGVSRSMISLVERGEVAATAVVLERLASALGLTLAALFDVAEGVAEPAARGPVARRAEQPLWQDPGSGYQRRNVSPAWVAQPMQLVEVLFPAGARVAFESGPRPTLVHQQVWVLEGRIDVNVGEQRHRLDTGDCLAMQLDAPTMFHNPTRKPARYAVVLAAQGTERR